MTCPLCGKGKARRACPALGHQICSTCCGTKRLKEIQCPSGCGYLAAARAHPAASVQRQHERDVTFLMTLIDGLSKPQMEVLSEVNELLHWYRPTALPTLVDADVHDAAAAMALTLDTAARGIVYEHQTPSLPAQRLLSRFRQLQSEIESRGPAPPAVLAAVFRRVERACRDAAVSVGGPPAAFLDFMERVAARADGGPREGPDGHSGDTEHQDPPRIFVPGA